MKPSKTIGFLSILFLVACSEDATPADQGIGPDLGPDAAVVDSGQTPDTAPAVDTLPDLPLTDGQPPDLGAVTPHSWVTVKRGTFTMGSPTSENCREPDTARETPHKVTLTRSFQIATREVTQQQFQATLWYNPSKFNTCGANCPVEKVSWHEAALYCNALSDRAGLTRCYSCTRPDRWTTCSEATAYSGGKIYSCPGYRLPTEAEWEVAARGGTTGGFPNGEAKKCLGEDPNAGKMGWYRENAANKTHLVAQKAANPWGLFDMSGNVWEWCNDWFTVDLGSKAVTDPWGSTQKVYRVTRGGAWFGFARNLRSARRFQKEPTFRCHGTGFRPVRTLPASSTDAGPSDAGPG